MSRDEAQAWKDLEKALAQKKAIPQPKGSVTTKQYSNMMGVSHRTARERLNDLEAAGLARREKWLNGNVTTYVYFVAKKK